MTTAISGALAAPWHPRVLVTGHNGQGQAVVQESYNCPESVFHDHNFTNHHLWSTSEMPPDLNDDIDIKKHKEWLGTGKVGITNKNGTVCRFVNFPPGHPPLMHRTQSLDYGIVLNGTVLMQLDDGSETLLKEGDIAVQRATMHAWKNPSRTEWTRMVFVLQDCQPLKGYKEDLGEKGGLDAIFAT